ncbi:MAG: bifunctional methylenetetrahydrofolate dehydrogenase/methenyltetrahydrofolate cyclohydrolase FolD [Ignavibacteriae bacterium]|nr:bifunctional methylenetetrahydrofolate dehydrogenase/methenyltetrahydrofolate cyclohydrolase FolD [Ignavibacteriota bacterium]MCB9216483.1 bifunctional methylenetetrahydrofolate dehydrogenase/methenyltetrahydrofolate cyclohydrolase FolD [Ignavibacteria bacterium]
MSEPIILKGKPVADAILDQVARDVNYLKEERGITPGLSVVLVGDDPASATYVGSKERKSRELGLNSVTYRMPENTSEEELLDLVERLNNDPTVHGILVQSPLPSHIDYNKITLAINPVKDVDGFHPVNVGKLVIGLPGPLPCTPAGVVEMLKYYKVATSGKRAVVVGRSNIVGKPLANLLAQKRDGGNAIVTIAHSAADDLGAITREADILLVAIGRPNFIGSDMVKEGAVVIDVGINRVDDPDAKRGYRVVGDVDYNQVAPKCSAITPVPGGVGLMTIAMLMQNTIASARGDFNQS